MRKPYPLYKDSRVEWIGEVPSHWSIKRGKFLFNNKKEINSNFQCENLLSLTLDGVLKKDMSSNEGLRPMDYKTYQVFYPDNLVFKLIDLENIKTSRVGYVQEKGIMSPVYIRLEKKQNNCSKFYYYQYYDLYKKNIFNFLGEGVRSALSPSDLLEIPQICPFLPEQKQIVDYLENKINLIDELIEKTKQKIELLKEKRTSLINHCVTKGLDSSVEIKDSGIEWIGKIPKHWSLQRGSTIGKYSKGSGISKDEVKESGIPCIRYGEIYTTYDRLVYSSKSFVSDDDNNKVKVSKGSVFLTGSGETIEDIGKSVVYMGESNIYVGGDIIIINLKDGILPLFISYLINAECIRFQKSMFGKGEIIVHIYPKNIREIIFCIPPTSEQKQIVEYLDLKTKKIDILIKKENKRIELLKEYRKSLISETVTGKIDVRDEEAV